MSTTAPVRAFRLPPFGDGRVNGDQDGIIIPVETQLGIDADPPAIHGIVGYAVRQERDLDILAAVGVQVDFHRRVATGGSVQGAAGEVGVELGQQLHDFERRRAQVMDAFALLVFLVERLPGAQFCLDFFVGGKRLPLGRAQAPGCPAFRRPVVADAFFRHQARCGAGNGTAQVAGRSGGELAAWHGDHSSAAAGYFGRLEAGGGHFPAG